MRKWRRTQRHEAARERELARVARRHEPVVPPVPLSPNERVAAFDRDAKELGWLLPSLPLFNHVPGTTPIERTQVLLNGLCLMIDGYEAENPTPWWSKQTDRTTVESVGTALRQSVENVPDSSAMVQALVALLGEVVAKSVGMPDAYAAILALLPMLKEHTEAAFESQGNLARS